MLGWDHGVCAVDVNSGTRRITSWHALLLSFTLLGWGQHLAALPALWLPFRLALFKLGSCLPWWSCHGAQQLRFVELHPKSSCGNRDIKKRLSLKVRVLSFTSLHPMMWSGIYRAPDLTAGTALVGHRDNFCPSQRIILLAEYFL